MNHTFALNKFDAASTATECNQLVKAYIKGIANVFRAGLRDPCTRDVARLSESVKILEPQASVFLRFPKVEQHPKCMDHAILLGKPFGNCFIK
jgi:hypothetical protein